MKVSIQRNELKQAVAGFAKVVNGKTTLPILGGVRFENNSNGIVAQVTDLDQHLRYRFVGAQGEGDGAFVMPLANLKDLVQGKAQEMVEFEAGENGDVSVTNHVGDHAVRHPIQGLDIDDWPTTPVEVTTEPADRFLETYRRLVPFASTEASRYLLNSVYVEVADKGDHPVTMVATDGRRLSAWNTMNLPLPKSVIVPTTKFLSWAALQGEVGIGLRTIQQKKETQVAGVAVSVGPWFYDVRAVDGTYPNWRQVIPGVDAHATRVVFNDADVAVLQKVLPSFPGSNTSDSGIQLRTGTGGKLVIAGKGPDDATETTHELTGGSTYTGTLPAIGVNCFFLLEALTAGFRTFTTTAELCPLRSEDGKGGVHVLMPLKISPEPVKKVEPQVEARNGNGVTGEAEEVSQPTTPTPAEEKNIPKGASKTMTKEGNGTGTPDQGTALDRLQAAYEAAKQKVRDASAALVDVAAAIKDAQREDKQLRADVESVRTGLAKIQSIKV